MGRNLGLILVALALLAACGVGGPPEGASAVDLTEFWRGRR